jgi:tRNA-Thr(GGU) m(6)t(6)A37 methyltransferase TsaA
MNSISLTPVGVVRSTRTKPSDDNWDAERVRVELDPAQFLPEALAGLADFSHVDILFFMDRVDPGKVEKAARHPRNNANWPKVGIFAQRGRNRPNQIGLTICRILRIDGLSVYVEGLDAIDGSPVLDIKPWVAEFGPRGSVRQPEWISELMRGYWRE